MISSAKVIRMRSVPRAAILLSVLPGLILIGACGGESKEAPPAPAAPAPSAAAAPDVAPPADKAALTEINLPTPNAYPHSIAVTPDGSLWFTELQANKLGTYDPQTQRFREFTVPTAGSNPHGIGAAPDGAIWTTEQA